MVTKETSRLIKGQNQLAIYLGVHKQTVYNWYKQNLLNSKRVGRTIFFDPENLWKEKLNVSRRKK